ncbi:hypothetical protein Tco_0680337 [Tanacetum coccineum]|uniref:Retrovirus-related Pol polyprotein from transposon TNT 1-94-like beta-barrel domain-containing protein n=1 Tax=Tanacetum coccineum TaxID=301880 RepID=A0ABQ4XK96_9ASTR
MILSMFKQMSNHATNWDKADNESKIVNESLTTKLDRYKERVKILKQRFNVDLSDREKFIDSQMDDMIRMMNIKFAAFETEIDTLKQTLSKHVNEKESLLTTLNCFKMKFKERESKSVDKEIVLRDFVLAEESRLKMVEKLNDLIMKKEKINITPINYSVLNKLAEDFGKLFVPQQELSAEQKFLLQSSDKNSEEPSTSNTPVKIEVPSELSKVSFVNKSLKKLRFHLASFDKVVKVRTTPDAITEGLLDEITEVQTVFTKMEAAVEQCSVDRKCSQLQAKDTVINKLKETIHSLRENANPTKVKKDIEEIETINIELEHSVAKFLSENEKLHKEREHLKKTYKELCDSIKPSRVHAKEQCDSLIANLNSKKLKGKNVIDTAVSKPYATIAPGMFKLNFEPLAPKVLKNKDAHLEYIKHSREHADILREIFKSARGLSPLDSNLDSALIGFTGASGSKPIGNTKNNRILQSSSSNKTNKVEDQSRSVKSRKNKKNRVANTECNAYVIQSMLNENSKYICAICNECFFDANHDKCVLDYVHDVNVVQIVLWYLDSGCSKHMTENRSQLTNFVNKFLGTVKFGNDQIAKIMGYGDYQIENVTFPGEDLGKLKAKADVDFDELTVMASKQSSSGPVLHEITPGTLSLGLVPQPPSSTPFVPQIRDGWDTLIQPLFDEYFCPPPCFDHPVSEVVAPVSAVSTGSPSSTSADQDSPSTKPSSKESSSQVVIPNNVCSVIQPPKHISKWTKHHSINNVIGDPSRLVSTRHQLQTEAMFCYFDAFLSSVEPNSYKEALAESC